jgi:ubiquinone/menaquinone biosynthesis C-methylase UbiE
MVDWGVGEYERTAAELEPAARHVVELAAIAPGERVLDVACGTGNAALIGRPPAPKSRASTPRAA